MTESEMKTTYRKVFNTPQGKLILEDILNDLHILDNYVDVSNQPLVNYGRVLLWKLGVLDNTPEKIINKMLELDPVLEGEDDADRTEW